MFCQLDIGGDWSGRRESNPYLLLGRQGSYHYTTPAAPRQLDAPRAIVKPVGAPDVSPQKMKWLLSRSAMSMPQSRIEVPAPVASRTPPPVVVTAPLEAAKAV